MEKDYKLVKTCCNRTNILCDFR